MVFLRRVLGGVLFYSVFFRSGKDGGVIRIPVWWFCNSGGGGVHP